jgi:hypothetical protein
MVARLIEVEGGDNPGGSITWEARQILSRTSGRIRTIRASPCGGGTKKNRNVNRKWPRLEQRKVNDRRRERGKERGRGRERREPETMEGRVWVWA